MMPEGLLAPGASVLVPGAGRGHEARALAKLGFRVTAVDFAEEAVKAMRKAGPPVEAVQADLFDLPRTYPGRFDALFEHTCFCAIDPARRAEYAEVAWQVLKPSGLALGVFYHHGREGGPPFDVGEEEIRRLFARRFELTRLTVAKDSFPEREGKEMEFVFRRR